MIRKKTGLKELTILLLASAAFVSVACGDDDDDTNPGTAGTAGDGGSSTAGSGSGGKAGSGGGGKAGSDAGGKAGSDAGGKAGSGNGGTAGTGGTTVGGEGGVPPEGGGAGEGGEPMGGAPMGGAGGEGGMPEVAMDTIGNASFDVWNAEKTVIQDWTNTSDPAGASYFEFKDGGTVTGGARLSHYLGAAYKATTQQTVSPIKNGKYTFSIWVKRVDASKVTESYVFAKEHDAGDANALAKTVTDLAIGDTYVKITTPEFDVTSGKVTIGVYTDAAAEAWFNFDDAELTPVTP